MQTQMLPLEKLNPLIDFSHIKVKATDFSCDNKGDNIYIFHNSEKTRFEDKNLVVEKFKYYSVGY